MNNNDVQKKVAGIEINVPSMPPLDGGYIPFECFIRAYLKGANKPVAIAVEREGSARAVYHTFVHDAQEMREANYLYLSRLLKFLLWSRGGYRITLCGDEPELFAHIQSEYQADGARAFDVDFMQRVYSKAFEVEIVPLDQAPLQNESAKPLGGHLGGCRIGFDAGGSDRKVSAVLDGQPVYDEEVLWTPKEQSDPDYHYREVLAALQSAAEHLPRVDAVGVSSAGVCVGDTLRVSSLFIAVPQEDFQERGSDVYRRAVCALGEDIPMALANDGDVAALAGSISLERGNILGIALGTSEAAGFVDADGNITGWLNELAFAPLDVSAEAPMDDWSKDIGVGSAYLSQDAVMRLCEVAGVVLDAPTKALRLKQAQQLHEERNEAVKAVFQSIGCYAGHAAALYRRFYDARLMQLMGRVTSGIGGDIILLEARRVLRECYPDITDLELELPDEKSRRVGQSVAAASLVQL